MGAPDQRTVVPGNPWQGPRREAASERLLTDENAARGGLGAASPAVPIAGCAKPAACGPGLGEPRRRGQAEYPAPSGVARQAGLTDARQRSRFTTRPLLVAFLSFCRSTSPNL